jgi:hypothetical protein
VFLYGMELFVIRVRLRPKTNEESLIGHAAQGALQI